MIFGGSYADNGCADLRSGLAVIIFIVALVIIAAVGVRLCFWIMGLFGYPVLGLALFFVLVIGAMIFFGER